MMETNAPGLHDAILLCAGIASVYLVVAVLQLMQMRRSTAATLPVREPSLGVALPFAADSPKQDGSSFANELRQRHTETEMKRLGLEVERLHAELHAMQDEIKQLRRERNVTPAAPLYNEAMSFARRGLDAAGIASRCGISLGEAELVVALARDPKDFGLADDELSQPLTLK